MLILALMLLALFAPSAAAQVAPDSAVVVVPGPQFRAGGAHRFLLGDTHRNLWTTPIRVAVLDLAVFGGGLTATEKGGSKQSRSLRFRGGDGRTYSFRALEKDPTQTWPPALRASPARRFAEDQISAIYPAGAVAVAVLERAAGLVNPGVQLVVLPDDPRLGEWRTEFAGLVGTMEQRLRGSGASIRDVPGATEIISTEALFKRLRDRRHTVDEEAFLAARLFDVFIGDWDRHEDQWSWARYRDDRQSRWAPLPRDRDWALSKLDGPLYSLLRLYLPKYQSFGPEYGRVYGMTLAAEPLDRRLLTGLSRRSWDSVVVDLKERLSDDVIDSAVAVLPVEFPEHERDLLRAALRNRRARLPSVADEFYHQLAVAVDLRGSDAGDVADLSAGEGGELTVRIGGPDGTARAERTFLPNETGEVRLFLFGGADSVRWSGGTTPITVRVIDPEGASLPPQVGGRVFRYDSTSSRAAVVDSLSALAMPRDWGALYSFSPWFEARPGIGTLIGGGPVIYRYGFRKVPYAARIAMRAAVATGVPGWLNADLDADFRFQHPGRRLLIRAAYLRIDVTRYFGLGNETVRSSIDDFDNVRQKLYIAEPTFEFALGRRGRFALGGFVRSSVTDLDRVSALATDRPYGSGKFTEAGMSAGLGYDSRDHDRYPTRGLHAELRAIAAPGIFDVAKTFGRVNASVAGYATAPGLPASPTLAVRAGGTRVIGDAPFFEAASIGGRSSVRGLNSHRFIGDGSLFGSAELRLALGGFTFIVPGEWGVFGLGDVGRVYLEGERSNDWHTAVGGGLWFAFLNRASTITATFARSEERSKIYVQAGFHF